MEKDTSRPGGGGNAKDGKIELRSEKVRRLTGDIPTSLVVWSIAVMALVAAALAAAVSLLPYPHSDGESILRHLLR